MVRFCALFKPCTAVFAVITNILALCFGMRDVYVTCCLLCEFDSQTRLSCFMPFLSRASCARPGSSSCQKQECVPVAARANDYLLEMRLLRRKLTAQICVSPPRAAGRGQCLASSTCSRPLHLLLTACGVIQSLTWSAGRIKIAFPVSYPALFRAPLHAQFSIFAHVLAQTDCLNRLGCAARIGTQCALVLACLVRL